MVKRIMATATHQVFPGVAHAPEITLMMAFENAIAAVMTEFTGSHNPSKWDLIDPICEYAKPYFDVEHEDFPSALKSALEHVSLHSNSDMLGNLVKGWEIEHDDMVSIKLKPYFNPTGWSWFFEKKTPDNAEGGEPYDMLNVKFGKPEMLPQKNSK